MIDWRAGLKDAMWSMFLCERNAGKPVDREADKEALKKNCALLIRMATQKTAGQDGYRGRNDIDWNSLDRVLMMIACCACRLCLDGEFGEMPDYVDEG